jgi:hypothetical protein
MWVQMNMNTRLIIPLLVSCLVCPAMADDAPPVPTPFAVVELFTSEGCSSCPPADQVLREIRADALAQDQRVFVMAFHVDYWDRLGWKDRYSDNRWTQRQYSYAQVKRSTNVYTPQMIINGGSGFVGSQKNTAKKAISEALKQDALVGIALHVDPLPDGKLPQEAHIHWQLTQVPDQCDLVIVLVENDLVNDVLRGENSGRKLKHDGVVRNLMQLPLTENKGEGMLTLPKGITLVNSKIIAMVQQTTNMKIIGAQRVDLHVPSEK